MTQEKKILIIQPTYKLMDGKLVKEFPIFNYSYNLPILSGCIPEDWEKNTCLEYIEEIDFNSTASLVIITSTGYDISHSVEIINKFKTLGKTVIFGAHMDELSDKILKEICDSVFYGYPNPSKMQELLNDFENDRLKEKYSFGFQINYPFDYSVFKKKKMLFLPVIASLGCRHKCEYCCYPPIYNGRYYLRNIEYVIADLKQCQVLKKPVAFLDANLYNNREFLFRLCNRIIEEKISILWGAQCTVNIGDDFEILSLMHKAGCRMVFLGLETLNLENMSQLNKVSKVNEYEKQISNIHFSKIHVGAFFMLGMDEDDEKVFENIYNFCIKNKIEVPYINIYFPILGTAMAERLKSEGRVPLKYFDNYLEKKSTFSVPCSIAYFEPSKLTKEQLEKGFVELFKKLTMYKNIIKRIYDPNYILSAVLLRMNLEARRKYKSMQSRAKAKILNVDANQN